MVAASSLPPDTDMHYKVHFVYYVLPIGMSHCANGVVLLAKPQKRV